MKPERLEALADGVFAIVLTLLVLELKVPQLHGAVSDRAIWNELKAQGATWLGFLLSFSFLFSIWRIHHFIMSVFAKNLDNTLTNWNGWFLLFVAIVPFSAHLLGSYPFSPLVISIYGINVIGIGATVFGMRRYVITSDKIQSVAWTRREEWSANIRLSVPLVSSLAAIAVAWSHPGLSLWLFVFGIVFNLTTWTVRTIYRVMALIGIDVPKVEIDR